MAHLAALTLLSLSLVSAPTCPDDGRTVFLETSRGFQGFRLIGGDSYRSFFRGEALERAAAEKPAPGGRAEFWVDDVLAQWMLVGRDAFMKADAKGEREVLEAFYGFQFGFLTEAGGSGAATLGAAQPFEPLEKKGADGKARLFKIWSAALGKESEATQFWVATPHPRGVVVLTVIAPSADAVAKARALVDAYMTGYGPIDAAACRRLRANAGKGK